MEIRATTRRTAGQMTKAPIRTDITLLKPNTAAQLIAGEESDQMANNPNATPA